MPEPHHRNSLSEYIRSFEALSRNNQKAKVRVTSVRSGDKIVFCTVSYHILEYTAALLLFDQSAGCVVRLLEPSKGLAWLSLPCVS